MFLEEWRDVPGYEKKYAVSNLGRVMSLNYGGRKQSQILKAKKKKNGYLFVCLSKEGKTKYFHIHRLVAQAFIPNPNNLPQVNHVNERKSDNRVENLEWCTPSYNNRYGTRVRRQIETGIKNGTIYDPVEREEKYREHQKEYYEKNVKGNPVVRERNRLAMRRRRARMTEEEKKAERAKKRKYRKETYVYLGRYKTPIVAYDRDGKEIGRFVSQMECAEILGIPQGCVSNIVRGKSKQRDEFKLYYAENASYKPISRQNQKTEK